MKIIFNTLNEATNLMENINKNFPYLNCHFENVKGEVHIVIEEEAITII